MQVSGWLLFCVHVFWAFSMAIINNLLTEVGKDDGIASKVDVQILTLGNFEIMFI